MWSVLWFQLFMQGVVFVCSQSGIGSYEERGHQHCIVTGQGIPK